MEGTEQGRAYVSDGRSHLMAFAVNGVNVGERESELRLSEAGTARVTATVAALLDDTPDPCLKEIESPKAP